MPRDGQTISYTGEEALAITLWQHTTDEYYEHWVALLDCCKDGEEVRVTSGRARTSICEPTGW